MKVAEFIADLPRRASAKAFQKTVEKKMAAIILPRLAALLLGPG
jgi:hypothetical protein